LELSLHQWYTADEAIAALGDPCVAELQCDGQFVVLPTAVLCLATVGNPATEPYTLIPSSFVWKPKRLDYDPADKIAWLPAKARDVLGPDRVKIKEHHIYLRAAGDERFLYAGTAHLGSYGNNGKRGQEEAGFSLNVKLPREAWLHLGGFPGWRVELNHKGDQFLDRGDVEGFQRLVEELPRKKFGHLYLTRYEEDSLTLHTNAGRGWLTYQRNLADSGSSVRDLTYDGDPVAQEFFVCACGIDLEFPAKQTLPRELAMQAVVAFFRTGELPRSTQWAWEESRSRYF